MTSKANTPEKVYTCYRTECSGHLPKPSNVICYKSIYGLGLLLAVLICAWIWAQMFLTGHSKSYKQWQREIRLLGWAVTIASDGV